MNHIRLHSWCPPRAAFVAADQLGMLLQVECSAWANFGDGTAVDQWIHQESARMLDQYGNHPSFMLMAASNEPHGKQRAAVLEPLVRSWAANDPRHFYTCGAGWPHLPANQFHINQEGRLQRFVPLRLDHRPQTDYLCHLRTRYGATGWAHSVRSSGTGLRSRARRSKRRASLFLQDLLKMPCCPILTVKM